MVKQTGVATSVEMEALPSNSASSTTAAAAAKALAGTPSPDRNKTSTPILNSKGRIAVLDDGTTCDCIHGLDLTPPVEEEGVKADSDRAGDQFGFRPKSFTPNSSVSSSCPCIDCQDPEGKWDRVDNALISRKNVIQHQLKKELPEYSNDKIIDLSMHLVLREKKLLEKYHKEKVYLTQVERTALYKFPVYSTHDMELRAERREKERKNGVFGTDLCTRLAPILDDGALAAADECAIFDTIINGKRIDRIGKRTQNCAHFGGSDNFEGEEENALMDPEAQVSNRSRRRRRRHEEFLHRAVASSCRVCSLKCGLRCLSMLCLLFVLAYLLISSIMEKNEFWKWADRYAEKNAGEPNIMQKVDCNSTPAWVKDFLKKLKQHGRAKAFSGNDSNNFTFWNAVFNPINPLMNTTTLKPDSIMPTLEYDTYDIDNSTAAAAVDVDTYNLP